MIKINVIVKNKSWFKFVKNPETYFKRKIKKIENDKFFGKRKYSFSLQLSDTKEIQFLNKKFRKKNKSTDILSFPNQNKKNLRKITKLNFEIYLGDIIINLKKMNTFSKILFKKHLDVLWIHGLVHLFGYKHKLNKDFHSMNQIEKKYFNYIS